MLIAIPVMGQFEIGRLSLYCFDQLVSQDTHFLLIDNTPTPSPWSLWVNQRDSRWAYMHYSENQGLAKYCQHAFHAAQSYDILCLTHNDLWIYVNEWDLMVTELFERDARLGGIGLFGSKGCDKGGVRLNTFGRLIEMSGHGRKRGN